MSSTLRTTRDRIDEHGSHHLTDAEILAVLLAAGGHARDALVLAQDLLQQAGGLQRLLAGECTGIAAIRGIGRARVARLSAAVELGRRYLGRQVSRRHRLASPLDAVEYVRARLVDLPYEVFGCLFLDTRHRVICFEPLFRGTLDGAAVYPREVLKRALHHNAGALILAHNHPSGDSEPSEADRAITTRLAKALALVDIRLLDHLVVAAAGHVSLAERGWI